MKSLNFIIIGILLSLLPLVATSPALAQNTVSAPPAVSNQAVTTGNNAPAGQTFLFDMVGSGIEAVLGPIMDRMLQAMQMILDTVLALSDDIGTMSDRILVMADNIGIMADRILTMADKIGEMADRIVATMQMMSDNINTLAARSNATTAGYQSGAAYMGGINATTTSAITSTVLLTSPASNAVVSTSTPPPIAVSDNPPLYMLYGSTTPTFSEGQTVAMIVSDNASLTEAWNHIVAIAEGDSVYLAVKSIDGDSRVSALSNGVRVTLTHGTATRQGR